MHEHWPRYAKEQQLREEAGEGSTCSSLDMDEDVKAATDPTRSKIRSTHRSMSSVINPDQRWEELQILTSVMAGQFHGAGNITTEGRAAKRKKRGGAAPPCPAAPSCARGGDERAFGHDHLTWLLPPMCSPSCPPMRVLLHDSSSRAAGDLVGRREAHRSRSGWGHPMVRESIRWRGRATTWLLDGESSGGGG